MGKTCRKEPHPGQDCHGDMVWCECCECEIPNKKRCLDDHFKPRSNHEGKKKLALFQHLFQKEGLDYFPSGTTYYFQKCRMQLPNIAEELLYHIKKFAYNHGDDRRVRRIQFSLAENEIFVQRSVRLVDFETTNEALTEQLLHLSHVESPTTLVQSGPSKQKVFELRNDVFTPEELQVVTRVASYLQEHGRSLGHSPAKASSQIFLFGMRSAYGDTGWYVHDRPECYLLSEDLAKYICHILRRSYGSLFQHLDSIPISEGFSGDEARVGGGPFTSFSISRDFNCRPHKDEDDYDVGFVIWLRDDSLEEKEPAIFAFPEASVMFVPKHGDVCAFRASKFLHCTRRLQRTNLLGLAFLQKCSLYRQLRLLIHEDGDGRIDYRDKKGNFHTVETREGFLEKKRIYKQRLLEGSVSIKDFITN